MKRLTNPCREVLFPEIHPNQINSHKRELPNHVIGLPSNVVSRGASVVTRQEANEESW